MIIPVRCFTCGKPVASTWHPYTNMIAHSVPRQDALDRLDITRYCCRRMLLAHVELSEKFMSVQQRVETRAPRRAGLPDEDLSCAGGPAS